VSYRARSYGLGEDETEFFAWRPAHHVTIGHDVCTLFAQTAAFAGCSAGVEA
jgi:hypothetical protein